MLPVRLSACAMHFAPFRLWAIVNTLHVHFVYGHSILSAAEADAGARSKRKLPSHPRGLHDRCGCVIDLISSPSSSSPHMPCESPVWLEVQEVIRSGRTFACYSYQISKSNSTTSETSKTYSNFLLGVSSHLIMPREFPVWLQELIRSGRSCALVPYP